uniref:CARD domain-containing protein n=1 Tax=Cyprinus carpio TaxID=7962 RepID=A0A8C1QUC6_CYPCA
NHETHSSTFGFTGLYCPVHPFVCPHAGQFQCSLTSLVFVMASEGEVLYRVVSWNPGLLDGLGQMKPAGPLYNIDCFNEENKDSLAVARFTGGNVEIMKPLKVSETHVIIDIRDLSHFGLLKRMIFPPSPVTAQVLLFLRPITERQRENILDVHLLPCNVPLSKVSLHCLCDQYTENTHIITSSKCSLTPESEYRLCCQTEGSTVQPGILLRDNMSFFFVITSGRDVEPPAYRRLTECEFVERHGNELIRRVSSVMAIADGLRTKKMIPDEMYSKVHAAEPRQEKTRLLLDAVYSGGAAVKAEFFILLTNEEPHLVDELESGPSRPQQF